jgi:hypothetical protein
MPTLESSNKQPTVILAHLFQNFLDLAPFGPKIVGILLSYYNYITDF